MNITVLTLVGVRGQIQHGFRLFTNENMFISKIVRQCLKLGPIQFLLLGMHVG